MWESRVAFYARCEPARKQSSLGRLARRRRTPLLSQQEARSKGGSTTRTVAMLAEPQHAGQGGAREPFSRDPKDGAAAVVLGEACRPCFNSSRAMLRQQP